jgi:hypothetical protein
MPDGTRNVIGGRDAFAAWARSEFDGDALMATLAKDKEPPYSDAFASVSKLGNAS